MQLGVVAQQIGVFKKVLYQVAKLIGVLSDDGKPLALGLGGILPLQ